MYCPRCSHQASPNTNVRFCPGCGLWLQGVAALVANDGFIIQDAETAFPKPRRSMVKRGAFLGATLMFINLLLILGGYPRQRQPILLFLSWIALMALIGVSGYVKRLFTKIFSEEEPAPSKKIAFPRGPALPAAYSAPVADSGRQIVDTAQVAQPSSVTEQTTSRLNMA